MGAGGRGICKAHNKPPAAPRLTNVMLYFITAAAAAAPARALQIPHPARTAGTGPRHAGGDRCSVSHRDRCSAPAHGTRTHGRYLGAGPRPARCCGAHSSLGPFRAVSPRNDPPFPPICMHTRSYINSSNSLIH